MQGALRNIRIMLRALPVLAGAAFLALSALLGTGHALLSPRPLLATATMFASAVARHFLLKLEQKFVFTDYVHAEH